MSDGAPRRTVPEVAGTPRFVGTPYEVGRQHGAWLGPRLAAVIDTHLATIAATTGLDHDRLEREAGERFDALPVRFRAELEGLAVGAGLPVERLAAWQHAEHCRSGCSGVLWPIDGQWWVARTNDADRMDGLWGHAVERGITGRIPTLSIGLAGDVATATGANVAGLWIHLNWLDAREPEPPGALSPWILVPEALETCTRVAEVEALVARTPRDLGAILVAVDAGGGVAVLEVDRATHRRRTPWSDGYVLTNHRQDEHGQRDSAARLACLTERLTSGPPRTAEQLRAVLADPGIERAGEDAGTVYATLACPQRRELQIARGGFPAVTAGAWELLAWPQPTSGGTASSGGAIAG